jgi:outer membrane protein assembly factor BamB
MKLAIFLFASSLACGQNWPGFRGPNANGIVDGKTIPVSFDVPAGRNVLWKAEVPGLAFSGPIVWGDKLFLTTAISSEPKDFRVGLYGDVEPSKDLAKHTWKVICLDKKTGKTLWEQVAAEGIPKSKRHTKNTQASPTPATDGNYVAAWFGSQGLYVYDVNGKLAWKKDLGIMNSGWFYDPDYEWGMATSPVIFNGLVILQNDIQKGSHVVAFDIKTGRQVWRTERPDEIPSWGTPNVVEGRDASGKKRFELVTNATKAIRSYDPMTGKELWYMTGKNFNSETTASTPILWNDIIYIVNGYPPVQPLFAIKTGASGDISLPEGKETSDSVLWSKKRGGTRAATSIVYNDILYTVAEQGVLTAYNPKTGERLYQQRISQKGSAHSASPVIANGNMYLASEDGDLFVVKTGPKFELMAQNPVGEWMMATPAISDGVLYIRSAKQIIAIAEKPAQ